MTTKSPCRAKQDRHWPLSSTSKMHFPTRLIRAVTNLGLATGDPGPILFVFTEPLIFNFFLNSFSTI